MFIKVNCVNAQQKNWEPESFDVSRNMLKHALKGEREKRREKERVYTQ